MGGNLPEELSAAGLMVPEPSVTPKPLVACAEYIASAGARGQPRHGVAMLAQRCRSFYRRKRVLRARSAKGRSMAMEVVR